MQISVLDASSFNMIYDVISGFPNYNIYHSLEWSHFIEQTQDAKKLIYHITENDETVAFLPGFIIRKGPIKVFASPFEGWNTPYMGPLLRECVKVNNFLMSVRSRLKKDKFHYAQFTLSNIDQNLIRACGFQILEGNTYIARIADDPETVLSGYSKSTRKHVRRAINNGLAVEFTKDKSFIDIYYEQLCQVFDKSNMRPTYPKAKVEALWDCLMPSEKLLATQVSYDNAIIATRLDFFDGVYMHSFGSASEQNYLHLNPNELARYHVMSFAADNGIKYYDMTGGGSYKEKFGGEKTTITTVVYDPYGLLWFKEVAKKVYRLKFKFRRSKR